MALLMFMVLLPVAAEAQQRTFIFKNNSPKYVMYALWYRDSDGDWVRSGWWKVGAYSSRTMNIYMGGSNAYVYATEVNGDYHWPAPNATNMQRGSVDRRNRFTVYNKDRLTGSDVMVVNWSKMKIGNYSKYTWTIR